MKPISVRRASRGQMSDAMITMVFLTLSGGFQDAYTFFMRGRVFANAQTGNIVLMSERAFNGDWSGCLRYLAPLIAFVFGVFTAERVRNRYRGRARVHWRQWIVLCEIVLLGLVGLIPASLNSVANVLVSFVCALQVQAFRKVKGSAYASTMCIGNLRSGVEALDAYLRTRDRAVLDKALQYLLMLCCFALGAGLGGWLSPRLGLRAVWLCCGWLLISFCLMFIREEKREDEQRETRP